MSAFRPAAGKTAAGGPAAKRPRIEIQRATLSNGIVVVGSENHLHPSVVIRLNVWASPMLDTPEKAGLAALTASGLNRGTQRRTFEQINETVDAAGMGFSTGAGRHLATVSARCLSEDLPLAIDLLADVVQNPIFPESEIEQLRGQVLNGLRQADNDTASVADRHFRELIYPEGHPYRLRTHGYQETVQALHTSELQGFHAGNYGSAGAFIVVVGDVEFGPAVRQLEEALGDWRGATACRVAAERPTATAPVEKDVPIPGKTQSDLVLGVPCMKRSDPDYYALRMANLILGRLGMMGRLGETVREGQGLAYGVHSELEAGLGAGPWSVRAGVNPANIDRALVSIDHELARIRDDGITDAELLRGQRYSTGSMVLQLETNDGVAGVVQEIELFDLGLDFLDRYPSIIGGLTRDKVSAAAARYIPRLADTVRVIVGPSRG